MARPSITVALSIALLAISLGYLYNTYYSATIQRLITVFGIYRYPAAFKIANTEDLVIIDNTIHCEDIHYYEPAHELYTACEDSHVTRFSWFPPLTEFNASVLGQARASLFIINPDTKRARKLKLENFQGPLSTHGIDVIEDPKAGKKKAVYIFAVNHLPNPEHFDGSFQPKATTTKDQPKARSQIEIFRHELGSSTAQHVRSVRHSSIRTPNDIVALSPFRFLVTNDHYYRVGIMREIEDLYPGATWTETLDVELTDLLPTDAEAGVKINIAVGGIHNNNGLGHGRTDTELLITSAVGGSLHLVEPSNTKLGHTYQVVEDILLDSTIDNPSYFKDPYASNSFDASGFVLAGLARGVDLSKTHADPTAKDPVLVWYVKKVGDKWEKRLIFEDDGTTVRSASAAVLVAIDPAREAGKRRAWLYVTGFISANVVAVKIDL